MAWQPSFSSPDLWASLAALDDAGLDRLDFGVIGFSTNGRICHYNRTESASTGLTPARLMGRHVFEDVAQCMNNFMVAQRFEDARAAGHSLDVVIEYVLTWRMKPTRVTLRLLARPPATVQYLAIQRLT
ncbi:MAG: PAS domain-containing protein [Leptothrix sp. (in: b-proteobacteria)]